jgi:hypothetical protein
MVGRVPVRAAATLGLCLIAKLAVAQPEPSGTELASARILFNEARIAEERGDWTDALAKLDIVAHVKMTPQVRFHLGLCQEHTAQLVEALNNLERAASEGSEQNLTTVVTEAKEHAASVRARLPKLSIVLPRGVVARVEVDGRLIASALLSRPMPFDPGAHKIVATAPGLAFSQEISIGEREDRTVEVVLSSTSAPAVAPGAALPAPAEPRVAESVTADPNHHSSTLAWAAIGTGGAALLGASIAALVHTAAINEIDHACPTHQGCPRGLESSQSEARTFGALAAVLAVVGVGSATTGAILLLTPPPQAGSAAVAVGPWMTASGAGATGTLRW